MTIHLKDPNYLYNRNYYEKNFKEMRLKSVSVKNLMKLYSSKIDSKKKKDPKKLLIKEKNDIEIIMPKIEDKNIKKKIEIKENKINNNLSNDTNINNNILFKVENNNYRTIK